MKKIVSVLVACVLCLLMTGCPSKLTSEEKFYIEVEKWREQNLNYKTFALYDVNQAYFTWNETAKYWNDYTFIILSSDSVLRTSLNMEFQSNEEFVFRTISVEEDIIKMSEPLFACIAYEWEKSIDSVACTLHYTTTDGEEVSKDYVLDFTQTPFRDYRDK